MSIKSSENVYRHTPRNINDNPVTLRTILDRLKKQKALASAGPSG